MRWTRWALAAALLLAAVPASAQQTVVEGQKLNTPSSGTTISAQTSPKPTVVGGFFYGDTSGRGLHMATDGSLYTSPYSPDRDNVRLIPNVIQNTGLANAAADSSGVLDVHDLRHIKLLFKVVPSTGTGVVSRIAVSVRECVNGAIDSTSIFYEGTARVPQGAAAGAAAVDTIDVGDLTTGSATLAWSGEWILTAAANRNSPGNAVAATVFSYPNGIGVMLDRIYGVNAWWNRMSIRVRVIAGPTCAVTVSVLGTTI